MSQVIAVPNAILRQVAKPVGKLDKKVVSIVSDMRRTLLEAKNPQGVGLAAPQIGVQLRIFLIRPLPDKTITVFINPEIIKYSQRTATLAGKDGTYEGCLSVPRHYAPVSRATSVTIKYQTLANTTPFPPPKFSLARGFAVGGGTEEGGTTLVRKQEVFSGFPARIIQHEMDHLNGILFIDRVLSQNAKLYRVTGKDWEEVTL